ncbi:aldo/keto reductase, partial [Mesorhizobium sp. M7A.T.Ca.TU.009.01.1.1]
IGVPDGGNVQTNQVLYNLVRRGLEFDLAPWSRQRNIPLMAYSPVEQGALARNARLDAVAARHDATSAQIALAWVVHQEGIIAIPKASSREHVRQNIAALDIKLTPQDIADLDRAFPPPARKRGLEMI